MIPRIASPSRTKEIIEANGFYFKKSFGQNFLIDSNILERIADCAGITENDCVLEIGPGIGALTQVLAEHARKVIAVEIDDKLIPILAQTLKDYDNIKIVNQDVLKTDIAQLIAEENDGKPIKVVANLPYYITTPILMELLEKPNGIASLTVMVQREVAERMQAEAGSKDYAALSLCIQYHAAAKLDMIVPPSCFMPRPKVDSAVITLTILPEKSVSAQNEAFLFHIIRCAFSQRRKTLLNTLRNQGELSLSKEEILSCMAQAGLEENIRGERLSLADFAALSDALWICEKKKTNGTEAESRV